MAIDIFHTLHVIEIMENFIERKRPPENIRHQIDLSYKIENQSIIVFELRPVWNDPGKIMESNIAKITYVKTSNTWRVYWLRADLKWHRYMPNPTVKKLTEFVKLLQEDKHGCFWG